MKCWRGVIVACALVIGCEQPGEKPTRAPVERTTATETTAAETTAAETTPAAPVDATDFAKTAPMIAIGDLHGDIDPLQRVLRATNLADADGNWTGGDRLLVQTGDVLDRGDDEKEIYELLWSLRDQAEKAGGRVVLLNGNHEVMNVLGDMRYVTPGGAADFADIEVPDEPRFEKVPIGFQGRVAAFLPGGPWAQRLANQPIIARVNGGLFAHGGVHMAHVEHGIDAINDEMARWMKEGGNPPRWATDSDGPLWTRAWSGPDEPDCDELAKLLKRADAEFLAVGHTPQRAGVTSRCDGRLWLIDTGMSEHYGGPASAIAIGEDGEVRAVSPAG